MFDSGQGDSILFELPYSNQHHRALALFDGSLGNNPYDNYDAGKQTLIPYFNKHHYRRIDYVYVSHPHADHLGGIIAVFRGMEIGTAYDSGLPYTTATYKKYLMLLKEFGVPFLTPKKGDELTWGPVKVKVYNPPADHYKDTKSDVNNNSLVFKVTYGDFSIWMAGDAEEEAEEYMLHHLKREEFKSTVLKSPHHGSRTSSTPAYVKAIGPQFAMISVGLNNKFGLPDSDSIETYDKLNIIFRRTDLNGNVYLETDGKAYQWWVDREVEKSALRDTED